MDVDQPVETKNKGMEPRWKKVTNLTPVVVIFSETGFVFTINNLPFLLMSQDRILQLVA